MLLKLNSFKKIFTLDGHITLLQRVKELMCFLSSDTQIWEYIKSRYPVKVDSTGQHRPNNGINCHTNSFLMTNGSGAVSGDKYGLSKAIYIS